MISRDTLETVHERMNNKLALAEANTAAAPETGWNEAEHSSQDTNQSCQAKESLEQQYNISRNQAQKIYLPDFLKEPKNATDPAYKVRMLPRQQSRC